MGCFAILKQGGPSVWQLVASMVKVPALFFLTLAVTLPSLYVSNALVGSRLGLGTVLRLLAATLGVITAALASIGPITAFFSVSTTSYPFMILLNVAAFAVAGALGASFLLQSLHRLSLARELPPATESEEHVGSEKGEASPGALDQTQEHIVIHHVHLIFRCWVILFGLVGAQMGWVLRPFIGAPNRPFAWFRARDSSFFEAVWHAFAGLFS
jgi:hypothetical protein